MLSAVLTSQTRFFETFDCKKEIRFLAVESGTYHKDNSSNSVHFASVRNNRTVGSVYPLISRVGERIGGIQKINEYEL